MPRTERPPTPPMQRRRCAHALWQRNWGAALFLIGPALGLWLVNLIFAFPPALWFGVIAIALLMAGLLAHLLWRDYERNCRQRSTHPSVND